MLLRVTAGSDDPLALPRPWRAAARPSPPIADYAFLSDCHTGALVAPDGTIEWLCVPRFDAPSDLRRAARPRRGRLPPRALRRALPVARRYEPGTNMLETTWMTPTGWASCATRSRSATGEDERAEARTRARRPTTTPTTCSCAPSSASRARCRPSWSASRCSTTAPSTPSGPRPITRPRPPDADRRRAHGPPAHRPAPGNRGQPRPGAPPDAGRGVSLLRAVVDRRARRARHGRAGAATTRTAPRTTGALAGDGHFPDHGWRAYLQRSALC